MQNSEIVFVQKIIKKRNKENFIMISNALLKKKNRVTITSKDMKKQAKKIIFKNVHGYSYPLQSLSKIKDFKINKIIIETINSNMLIVFIYIDSKDVEINEKINRLKNEKCIGIDMGRKNICAIVNNFGEQPILIKGSRLVKLYEEDMKSFNDNLNELIKYMQEYIYKHKIEKIYIGDMHIYEPYSLIIEQFKKLKNVKLVLIDEEFTSKASFLDNDMYSTIRNFSGKRVTRGTYQTKKGIEISSDINAAYNILIKGNQFAFVNEPKVIITPDIIKIEAKKEDSN